MTSSLSSLSFKSCKALDSGSDSSADVAAATTGVGVVVIFRYDSSSSCRLRQCNDWPKVMTITAINTALQKYIYTISHSMHLYFCAQAHNSTHYIGVDEGPSDGVDEGPSDEGPSDGPSDGEEKILLYLDLTGSTKILKYI